MTKTPTSPEERAVFLYAASHWLALQDLGEPVQVLSISESADDWKIHVCATLPWPGSLGDNMYGRFEGGFLLRTKGYFLWTLHEFRKSVYPPLEKRVEAMMRDPAKILECAAGIALLGLSLPYSNPNPRKVF